jgi:predicted solute-binding protein
LPDREADWNWTSSSLREPATSRFVSMYVNGRTLNYGTDGRQDLGHQRGIIPIASQIDFVD